MQKQQQQQPEQALDEDEDGRNKIPTKTALSSADSVEREQLADDSERELISFRAQISEQAGRFDDMVEQVKKFCKKFNNLTNDERNLLSCAYKNVIGFRRTSWRVLKEALENTKNHEIASKEVSDKPVLKSWKDGSGNVNGDAFASIKYSNGSAIHEASGNSNKYNQSVIKSLLTAIENELKVHCNDIISILDQRLIPSSSGESRVFYYKMKGDYLRYLCEICSGLEREDKANESLLAYKTASDRATIELPPTHPVRLGLILNFSVFYYDIMRSPERSCRLAKQAFDDAIAELDTLSEESYRDSTIIMQLLRDNLTLWESEKSFKLDTSHQQQH